MVEDVALAEMVARSVSVFCASSQIAKAKSPIRWSTQSAPHFSKAANRTALSAIIARSPLAIASFRRALRDCRAADPRRAKTLLMQRLGVVDIFPGGANHQLAEPDRASAPASDAVAPQMFEPRRLPIEIVLADSRATELVEPKYAAHAPRHSKQAIY